MELINTNNQQLTMSSKEMAELTKTRHDSVLRTIKTLLEKGILLNTNCGEYQDATGRKLPCYFSDKRDSLIIVARLSPEFTAAVIDRWQELESQQTPKIPQTYAAALLEAGRLALELETQTKRIEKLFHTEKNFTSTMIAKEAGWKSAQEMHKALQGAGYIFKHRGIWELYAKYSDKGYQVIKSKEFENGHIGYTMEWTMSGREWLLNILESL